MIFHSKTQITVVFQNPVTLDLSNGKSCIKYTGKSDYNKLVFLVRHKYNLKTRKKRIVKKYIGKLLNEALRDYLKDKGYM
jgi:hypothetical protein